MSMSNGRPKKTPSRSAAPMGCSDDGTRLCEAQFDFAWRTEDTLLLFGAFCFRYTAIGAAIHHLADILQLLLALKVDMILLSN